MPLRQEIRVRYCAIETCEGQSTTSCLRCGLALCEAHEPAEDERCPSCESDYRTRVRDLELSPVKQAFAAEPAGVTAGVGIVIWLATTVLTFEPILRLWLSCATATVFVFLIPGLIEMLGIAPEAYFQKRMYASKRRDFLRERKLLPPPREED